MKKPGEQTPALGEEKASQLFGRLELRPKDRLLVEDILDPHAPAVIRAANDAVFDLEANKNKPLRITLHELGSGKRLFFDKHFFEQKCGREGSHR